MGLISMRVYIRGAYFKGAYIQDGILYLGVLIFEHTLY